MIQVLAELASILSILVAAFLALAGHEIGHVLGGKAGGLRLSLLVVGPLHVQRYADGRLHWKLNMHPALIGGAASSEPNERTDLRRAYLRMAAGGPLASLALGVLALALLVGTVITGPPTQGVLGHSAAPGLMVVAAASLAMGFGTLIPITVSGFLSDGARAVRLMRPGPEAERHAAVMALGSYHVAGRRPRDWDPQVVQRAVSLPDGSYTAAMGHQLAYYNALDRRDLEAAESHVRSWVALADGVAEASRAVIEIEAAYFSAAYGRLEDLDLKRPEEVGKSWVVQKPTRRRAEAARLLADGEEEDAMDMLRDVHGAMARKGEDESGFIRAEIERLCRHWGLSPPQSQS